MKSSRRPPHYDRDEAIVQQRVFADPAIHRTELETVFDRAWLFVGPVNWLAGSGDFVTSRMGELPVITWRGADGALRLFVNRCPWSDEPLTAEARGRALTLHCPCHRWPYAPEDEGSGGPEPERLAQVAVHRGLVFGNRDPQAASLAEWIGDFGWYLDLFLPIDGVEACGGDSFRWSINANWKLPVLRGCGEPLDDPDGGQDPADADGAQVSLAGGAVTVSTMAGGAGDDARSGLTPLDAVLFPNLVFDRNRHSLDVVHPIGPARCEIHSYCLADAGMTAEDRDRARRRFQFLSGPSGITQAHWTRQWEAITATAKTGRHRDLGLSLRMGMGKERLSNLPGLFAPMSSEANQRAFFDWWQRQTAMPKRSEPRLLRIGRPRTS